MYGDRERQRLTEIHRQREAQRVRMRNREGGKEGRKEREIEGKQEGRQAGKWLQYILSQMSVFWGGRVPPGSVLLPPSLPSSYPSYKERVSKDWGRGANTERWSISVTQLSHCRQVTP